MYIFLSPGIAGSSGSLWKEHRTFAHSTLRDFGFGRLSMEGRITREIEVLVEAIKHITDSHSA